MEPAPFAPDETGRLIALKDLGVLDTPPERRFDRVVQLASRLTGTPVALLSLVDETRVVFKSTSGLTNAGVDLGNPFREYWFCSHVVATGDPVVVTDARMDRRFDRLPAVTRSPGVVAYAGVPVRAPTGEHVGALAALSVETREFSEPEVAVLQELARLLEAELSALPHSTIDALTGAVNSRTFVRFGNRLLELGDTRGDVSTLLRLDVKGIGTINTTFGFESGDQALVDTAHVLGSSIRGSDLVGRVGPDEFAVLLVGSNAADAALVTKRIVDAITVHNATAGRKFHLELEMGQSEHQAGGGGDLAELLTTAALTAELGI